MTRSLTVAAAVALIATSSVQAGGYSFSLPNLWFPETPTVTVEKGEFAETSPQIVDTEE